MTFTAELPGENGTGRLVHDQRHSVRCPPTPQALPAAMRNASSRQVTGV